MLHVPTQPERCGRTVFACIESKAPMISWMLGRKEVKFALLFPTIAVDNLDRFRSGDHNSHHLAPADYRKPL